MGTPRLPRLEYALELVLYMLSQHHAIGLQTDCMVTVLAPVVEAARLLCKASLVYRGSMPISHHTNYHARAKVGLQDAYRHTM